ncbi:MAG: hypothetical protein PHG24_02600 [Candidatus Pacebacteria bacterium]|nr:hypothetical protein [Candidatus Paceibacterota bacterium]
MKKFIPYSLVFFFLLMANFCYAATETTTRYWCESGCGGEIITQTCTDTWRSCCASSSDDDDEEDSCTPGPVSTTCTQEIRTGIKAEPWQICVGSQYKVSGTACGDDFEAEGGTKFYFICSGSCLSNVTGVRFFDNPNYPQKPELTISGSETYPETCSKEDLESYPLKSNCIEPDQGSSSVDLPFKLDWDEDPYFMKTGKSPSQYVSNLRSIPEYESIASLGPSSYTIKMGVNEENVNFKEDQEFTEYLSKDFSKDQKELEQGYFYKILSVDTQPNYINSGTYRSSEYNFKVDHNACWLKNNTDYNLTIQTCCGSDGTNCNSGKQVNFKTSYAPELKSPEDLDWSGPNSSAWDAWEYLIEDEDYELDIEDRILAMPNSKYSPFDWEENSTSSYPNELVKFPIILDWCDVDDVNGEEKTEKGAWTMKLYQTLENDEGELEEVPYSAISDGMVSFPSKPVQAGATWTDVLTSNYYDKKYFTENDKYSWELNSCLFGPWGCKSFGEHWSFVTEDSTLSSDFRILHRDGDILGIPTTLNWIMGRRVSSVKYELTSVASDSTRNQSVTFNDLKLNTSYTFKVTPCSDYDALECEPENTKSITFKTTGMAPKVNALSDGQYVPFEIGWKYVQGAKSYKYNLNGTEKVIGNNFDAIYYPQAKSDTTYTLKVKSCSDEAGTNCGDYSELITFKTFKLGEVEKISTDANNGILYSNDRKVYWEDLKGANYYKYTLLYNGEDTSKTCTNLKNKGTITGIVSDPSFMVDSLCAGTYSTSITTCLDIDCNDYGETNSFSFVLDSKKAPEGTTSTGLVPCNRQYDDPTTAWDETQQCSLSHVFLLGRLLFDFLLSRLVPASLVILLLLDGGLYLFHIFVNFDNPAMNLIQRSKQLWKNVGIGTLIIFLAWTAINFFLLFLDSKMSVYYLLEQFFK